MKCRKLRYLVSSFSNRENIRRWGQSNSWVTGFCANLLLHEEHVLEVN